MPHSLLPLSFGSPLSRPLVLAQWVFNPMKHSRLSPARGRQWGRRNKGKTLAKLKLAWFHVQIVVFLFATRDSFRPSVVAHNKLFYPPPLTHAHPDAVFLTLRWHPRLRLAVAALFVELLKPVKHFCLALATFPFSASLLSNVTSNGARFLSHGVGHVHMCHVHGLWSCHEIVFSP